PAPSAPPDGPPSEPPAPAAHCDPDAPAAETARPCESAPTMPGYAPPGRPHVTRTGWPNIASTGPWLNAPSPGLLVATAGCATAASPRMITGFTTEPLGSTCAG